MKLASHPLRLLALTALVGLTTGATTTLDTYPRQPGVDAEHYRFDVRVSDDTDLIVARAEVSMRFRQAGVTTVWLDLASATSAGTGMTVSAVTLDGAPIEWSHERDRVTMRLPSPPAAGDLKRFAVSYAGVPADGLKILDNRYGDRSFFSVNWPNKARQWLAMIDHPYDKATSEFVVTAPVRYQVVANGLLQEELDLGDGNRRTHWKQSVPIASWLNAVGVAQFASRTFDYADGVALQTWVFHQDREAGIATFETPVREALDFYDTHIGPYPYEKLANVEAAGMGGGMEHASVIFYGARSVTMEPATGLVYHEIAHQWFGNSVTESDWDDVWLSEGFATYFTQLATEHYRGRDAFVEAMLRSRESVRTAEEGNPTATVVHDGLDDMGGIFNGMQYQKGGWVLHMLRGEIGTEAFWAGIRSYYARYRDSNASSDDLRRVMEEVSGRELGWFFDQWLRRPGSPVIEGWWGYEDDAVVIEVTQTQPGPAFRLGIDVGTVDGRGPVHVQGRVTMSERTQRFVVPSEGRPIDVVLDPGVWLHARIEPLDGR